MKNQLAPFSLLCPHMMLSGKLSPTHTGCRLKQVTVGGTVWGHEEIIQ